MASTRRQIKRYRKTMGSRLISYPARKPKSGKKARSFFVDTRGKKGAATPKNTKGSTRRKGLFG